MKSEESETISENIKSSNKATEGCFMKIFKLCIFFFLLLIVFAILLDKNTCSTYDDFSKINKALKKYHKKNNEFPNALDQLIPEYLQEYPESVLSYRNKNNDYYLLLNCSKRAFNDDCYNSHGYCL